VLRKPARPVIPIHEWFYQRTVPSSNMTSQIQESNMKVNGIPPYSIILALELSIVFILYPHQLSNFDLGDDTMWTVYDRDLSNHCKAFNTSIPLILTKSMTMTPADYQLHYMAPTKLGWCLWGERNKFVPLSSSRFVSVETT
jgi:hypothetical protein